MSGKILNVCLTVQRSNERSNIGLFDRLRKYLVTARAGGTTYARARLAGAAQRPPNA